MDQTRLHAEQRSVADDIVVKVTGEIDVSTTDILAAALGRAADVAVVVVADPAARGGRLALNRRSTPPSRESSNSPASTR